MLESLTNPFHCSPAKAQGDWVYDGRVENNLRHAFGADASRAEAYTFMAFVTLVFKTLGSYAIHKPVKLELEADLVNMNEQQPGGHTYDLRHIHGTIAGKEDLSFKYSLSFTYKWAIMINRFLTAKQAPVRGRYDRHDQWIAATRKYREPRGRCMKAILIASSIGCIYVDQMVMRSLIDNFAWKVEIGSPAVVWTARLTNPIGLSLVSLCCIVQWYSSKAALSLVLVIICYASS